LDRRRRGRDLIFAGGGNDTVNGADAHAPGAEDSWNVKYKMVA
jgi:hypothetical protein